MMVCNPLVTRQFVLPRMNSWLAAGEISPNQINARLFRWAPSSYQWSYNPYRWPYKRITGVTTPISGVIALLITCCWALFVKMMTCLQNCQCFNCELLISRSQNKIKNIPNTSKKSLKCYKIGLQVLHS